MNDRVVSVVGIRFVFGVLEGDTGNFFDPADKGKDKDIEHRCLRVHVCEPI